MIVAVRWTVTGLLMILIGFLLTAVTLALTLVLWAADLLKGGGCKAHYPP